MGATAAAGTYFKWCAGIGLGASLMFGTAYTIHTTKTVAPKIGEGGGIGLGGGIVILQNIPKGMQEMLDQQGVTPVAPPAVPPAAGAAKG